MLCFEGFIFILPEGVIPRTITLLHIEVETMEFTFSQFT